MGFSELPRTLKIVAGPRVAVLEGEGCRWPLESKSIAHMLQASKLYSKRKTGNEAREAVEVQAQVAVAVYAV